MDDIYLIKGHGNVLYPDNDDAAESISKLKLGSPVKVKWSKPRNYRFLKKFFCMLDVGFEAWEPTEEYKGRVVKKDREIFRENVIITAGFKYLVVDINGNVRWRAESISFANMDDERFEKVYSQVANVILEKILHNYTRADLDNVVEKLLGFT